MGKVLLKILVIKTLFTAILSVAYSQEADNVIGKKFTIESQALAEKRDIQIYFPESYNETEKEFPVLYILDGQKLFAHGVSVLQSFRSNNNVTPEFIVVGINNKYPDRFQNLIKPAFLEFIEKELIAYIDKKYRTTNERILYGWEYAGGFAVESLIKKPDLFASHILASPYPLHQSWSEDKSRLERLETKLKELDSHLYFSVSPFEGVVNDGTKELHSLLTEKAPSSLRWKHQIMTGQEHLSTAYSTLYMGVKDYFYAYDTFYIGDLNEFLKAGGLKNFYQYNKLRAERYGFSEEPDDWSMFSIVRNAIRADDFERFKLYMKEFESTDMLKNLYSGGADQIGQYYLKHNDRISAIEVYKTATKSHPTKASIPHFIGELYLKMGDSKKAKTYYKKAVEIAEENSDKKLAKYKEDLLSL